MMIKRRGFFDTDAEFAFAESGGDVRMRPGIDVGIYPKANGCDAPHPMRDGSKQRKLGRRFDVEAEDVRRERSLHFGFGLANARKYDMARVAAGRNDARQFACGHDVETAAEPRENVENTEVGIRLHRVADKMWHRRKSGVELAPRAFERCARVDEARRTELRGD